MGTNLDSEDILHKRAWEYFQVRAAQRLTTFNFYIVISSVVATAMFTSLQRNFTKPLLGTFLGGLLIILAFIFWKIDTRNRDLIETAKEALKHFESKLAPDDESSLAVKVFTRADAIKKDKIDNHKWWNPFSWYFSYTACLNMVYLVFAISAIAAIGFLYLL